MSQGLAYKIEVRGARNVLPMDPNGQSDPYCKVGLADSQTNEFIDPENVKRSKVHYVTLNPVWKGFHMIAKTAEHKIRVEVWDKDQGVDGDFEGMTILDLNDFGDESVDKWLPLVGRTQDEKVTGDINLVITRGSYEQLTTQTPRSRSNSFITSQELEKPAPPKEDEQRTIKKLTAELKTKSGKLDRLHDTNSQLDLHVVRLKQQVEQLQAELAKKNTLLESKEDALEKAKTYATELQKSLQEKQSVNSLVAELNDKTRKLEQVQEFFTKTVKPQKVKRETKRKESNGDIAVVGKQELKVEEIVEEWTEYAQLIENLEIQVKEKEVEVKEKEEEVKEKEKEVEETKREQKRQLDETAHTIETLQFDLKEKSEEIVRQRETQNEQTKQLEETKRELEQLREALRAKEEQLEAKGDQERQLNEVTETIDKLQKELAEKSTELREQQTRVEEIKGELQILGQLKMGLKEKEEELERMRQVANRLNEKEEEVERLRVIANQQATKDEELEKAENQKKQDADQIKLLEEKLEEKIVIIQKLEKEIVKQGHDIITIQGELTGTKLQMTSKIMEQETTISELRKARSDSERGNESIAQQLSKNTEAYAKLEAELKLTKEKLQETENELEKEKTFHQEIVVVRSPKQLSDQEEVIHESGGGQFTSHQIPPQKRDLLEASGEFSEKSNANNTTTTAKREKEQEQVSNSLRDLGMELEALDVEGPKSSLLPHIYMKNSVPKSPEAAKAKARGRACVCLK